MDSKVIDRLLAASKYSQLGAIIACAYGRDRDALPRFTGKAIMTSDDFIMCNFIDRNGIGHMGAFVGSRQDFNRNVAGIAAHCNLSASERAQFFETMNDWCGVAASSARPMSHWN